MRCATSIRDADDAFHLEPPSTRTLVAAAKLIAAGAGELEAAEVCMLAPLSSDGAVADGLRELAAATLARPRADALIVAPFAEGLSSMSQKPIVDYDKRRRRALLSFRFSSTAT